MKAVELLVTVLATRRVTRLVVEDSITEGLRRRVSETNATLDELVSCTMCTSFWAAALVVCLPQRARLVLAGSEAAIFIGNIQAAVMSYTEG